MKFENEMADPDGIQSEGQATPKGLKRKSLSSNPGTKKLRGAPKQSIKTGAKRMSYK